MIAENPFGDMKRLAVRGNPERLRFIERETITRVLAACPNADWRLIVVLCRFGGLRPSEACNLRWDQIDWERLRIRVRCEKTEHHEGREWREIPFFPEIVPHLHESWELAPERAEMVIERYRATQNLRKPFQDILAKAGIEAWPKPFQNLRSSRETELAREFPLHVVCSWIGNTQPVAREHYLQVTDEDYLRAEAAGGSGSGQKDSNSGGPKSGPVPSGRGRTQRQVAGRAQRATLEKRGSNAGCCLGAPSAGTCRNQPNSPTRIRT